MPTGCVSCDGGQQHPFAWIVGGPVGLARLDRADRSARGDTPIDAWWCPVVGGKVDGFVPGIGDVRSRGGKHG